nr:uncharacterized protein LOC111510208 isoform X2 [Leptinotarsa decemlineata]
MAGRFTKEEYMLLINTIREYRSLYDPLHKNYKCKIIRERSWEEIAAVLGKTVKECRMKWRNLRDHYMRGHLKNGNRHMQWTFYEPLSFLEKIRNHTQINGSSGTTEPDQNDDEDDVFSETEEKSTDRPNISHDAQDDRLVVTTVVVEDQDETNEDIDKFMQNIAARLKRLPQHSIDLAKMNILAQVTELELEQSWTISASEPYS